MKATFYSVPGAVRENGLESRLRSVLSRGRRLNPRVAAILSTTALGVGLAVLAVRPTLLKTPPKPFADIMAQAHETVTLPGGITVKMRGSFLWHERTPQSPEHYEFWDINGKPMASPYRYLANNKTTGKYLGSPPVYHESPTQKGKYNVGRFMEVWTPAGYDINTFTGTGSTHNLDGMDKTKPRHFAVGGMEAALTVAFAPWRTVARFDDKGKRVWGAGVTLTPPKITPLKNEGDYPTMSYLKMESEDSVAEGHGVYGRSDFQLVGTDTRGKDHVITSSGWSTGSSAALDAKGSVINEKITRTVDYGHWLWVEPSPDGKRVVFPKIVAYRFETRPATIIRFEGWKAPQESEKE